MSTTPAIVWLNCLLAEERGIARLEGGKLFGKVIFEEDGFHRADLGANAAINALGWIDEILLLIVIRMYAIDRQTSTHEASLVPMHG